MRFAFDDPLLEIRDVARRYGQNSAVGDVPKTHLIVGTPLPPFPARSVSSSSAVAFLSGESSMDSLEPFESAANRGGGEAGGLDWTRIDIDMWAPVRALGQRDTACVKSVRALRYCLL